MKYNIIRKHNVIILACYCLTSSELRLIYSCTSKIDYEQIIDKNNKTGNKYLSEKEILKIAQTSKYIGKTWQDIYNILGSQGYTFEKKYKY